MDNFFEGLTGQVDFGKQDGEIAPIPNNTFCKAEVVSALKKVVPEGMQNAGKAYYQIEWKIIEGQYKNRRLWQSLYCFDEDTEKAKRHRNILLFLMNMFGCIPLNKAPEDRDLNPMIEKHAVIKIGLIEAAKSYNGKWKNLVSEIFPHDYIVPSATGYDAFSSSSVSGIESAFSRNAPKPHELNDDIPF